MVDGILKLDENEESDKSEHLSNTRCGNQLTYQSYVAVSGLDILLSFWNLKQWTERKLQIPKEANTIDTKCLSKKGHCNNFHPISPLNRTVVCVRYALCFIGMQLVAFEFFFQMMQVCTLHTHTHKMCCWFILFNQKITMNTECRCWEKLWRSKLNLFAPDNNNNNNIWLEKLSKCSCQPRSKSLIFFFHNNTIRTIDEMVKLAYGQWLNCLKCFYRRFVSLWKILNTNLQFIQLRSAISLVALLILERSHEVVIRIT